jgi:hypothetical protein
MWRVHTHTLVHREHAVSNFFGTRLVYSNGKLLWGVERGVGDATAHDCTVVHGVSRLPSGVRYNLYAIFE